MAIRTSSARAIATISALALSLALVAATEVYFEEKFEGKVAYQSSFFSSLQIV
jgi:hypothetical protein